MTEIVKVIDWRLWLQSKSFFCTIPREIIFRKGKEMNHLLQIVRCHSDLDMSGRKLNICSKYFRSTKARELAFMKKEAKTNSHFNHATKVIMETKYSTDVLGWPEFLTITNKKTAVFSPTFQIKVQFPFSFDWCESVLMERVEIFECLSWQIQHQQLGSDRFWKQAI